MPLDNLYTNKGVRMNAGITQQEYATPEYWIDKYKKLFEQSYGPPLDKRSGLQNAILTLVTGNSDMPDSFRLWGQPQYQQNPCQQMLDYWMNFQGTPSENR